MIAEVNEEIEYSKKTKSIQDTLVPTLDTVRYQYMMDLCIKQNRSPAICSAWNVAFVIGFNLFYLFFFLLLSAIYGRF